MDMLKMERVFGEFVRRVRINIKKGGQLFAEFVPHIERTRRHDIPFERAHRANGFNKFTVPSGNNSLPELEGFPAESGIEAAELIRPALGYAYITRPLDFHTRN